LGKVATSFVATARSEAMGSVWKEAVMA
jgi:hypothetical protein